MRSLLAFWLGGVGRSSSGAGEPLGAVAATLFQITNPAASIALAARPSASIARHYDARASIEVL